MFAMEVSVQGKAMFCNVSNSEGCRFQAVISEGYLTKINNVANCTCNRITLGKIVSYFVK